MLNDCIFQYYFAIFVLTHFYFYNTGRYTWEPIWAVSVASGGTVGVVAPPELRGFDISQHDTGRRR